MTTFRISACAAEFVDALAAQGIDDPFPIQEATIDDALAGRDVCGKAQHRLGQDARVRPADAPDRGRRRVPGHPTALVLVPTRELAKQVVDVLAPLGKEIGMRVAAFYGGTSMESRSATCDDASKSRSRPPAA